MAWERWKQEYSGIFFNGGFGGQQDYEREVEKDTLESKEGKIMIF